MRQWDWMSFTTTGIAALLGTGFGALVAFWIEDRKRQQRLEDSRVEATNVAIFAMSRAFRDVESFRRERIAPVRESPAKWYTMLAGDFNAPPAPFDAAALAFLFETAQPDLPARVQFELDRYADFRATIRHRSEVHIEQLQPRIEQFNPPNQATPRQLEEMAGPRLFQTLRRLTDGIVTSADEIAPAIQTVARELRTAVRSQFPRRTIIRFEPIAPEQQAARVPAASADSVRRRPCLSWGWTVACHALGIALEIVGSLLIFLEARRMIAQLQAAGHVDYAGGPPPGYQDWIHDSGRLGFGLLLGGIILAGIALALEGLRQIDLGRPGGSRR